MLPGMLRRPSFMVTADFGGSAAGAGVGAGGGAVAAAGVATGAGGGGGGGGELAWLPSWACASQPSIAGALHATSAVNINGATIVRAILRSPVVSSGREPDSFGSES